MGQTKKNNLYFRAYISTNNLLPKYLPSLLRATLAKNGYIYILMEIVLLTSQFLLLSNLVSRCTAWVWSINSVPPSPSSTCFISFKIIINIFSSFSSSSLSTRECSASASRKWSYPSQNSVRFSIPWQALLLILWFSSSISSKQSGIKAFSIMSLRPSCVLAICVCEEYRFY